MPLFMDRHDIREATSEEVAQAHHKDLEIQAHHNCRALTYWHDQERGVAFCLVEAPSAAAVREMHREAHGLIPNQIIEVDSSAVSQFLGRVTDPDTHDTEAVTDSAFRAIMFIDMASSTDITMALGDSEALGLVHKYREIVRAALLENGGREVDRAGDGFLTSFTSAHASVQCAIAIQRGLFDYNSERKDDVSVQARIGIGAGEPVQDGEALFGSTVNLSARICSFGAPGQIVVARVVRDLCIGKNISFNSLGAHALKGFGDPMDLEEVAWHA